MSFIKVSVKTATIVHGYDSHNQEISEDVKEESFTTKLLAIDRLLSVSENFLLVSGSHGRVMYWEYEGGLSDIEALINQ